VVPALISLVIGFSQGWSLRARLGETAALRATVEKLEREARARDAAAKADQVRAETDAAERRLLEEKVDALQARPTAGDCLPDDAARRLRDLWGR
ncbi:hypothetical protein, partial [Rhodoplanes sp. SY1]|uniref:hypothetical protein n=1 Tax=Rhodoplanes sp. SY1 TaxID=3166646 RepID=UPI0038B4B3C5